MMRSLYSGVSGLKTHQVKMDVIGNNIANVNTVAYKSQSITFSELMYQTTQAASGPNEQTGAAGRNAKQIGLGVTSGAISTAISTQGSTQTTGNAFDLRITGDSFFVVSDPTGSNFFTRDGSFYVDAAGNLAMSSNGYNVMGWQAVEDKETGEINIVQDTVSKLQILSADNMVSPPKATEKATVTGILDKNDPNVTSAEGKAMSLSIYDNLGYSYTVKFKINDTDTEGNYVLSLADVLDSNNDSILGDDKYTASIGLTGEGSNVFALKTTKANITDGYVFDGGKVYKTDADGKPTGTALAGDDLAKAYGYSSWDDFNKLKQLSEDGKSVEKSVEELIAASTDGSFTSNGYVQPAGSSVSITYNQATGKFTGINGSATNSAFSLFIKPAADNPNQQNAFETVSIDMTDSQNFNNEKTSTMSATSGDSKGYGTGCSVGTLTGVSIQNNGRIYGAYDNGQTKLLGQIAVANFSNASGLEKHGDNLYSATLNSGEFDGIGVEVTSDGGYISTGVLEMSNVDLSSEFTEMITTQRGFQANSRIITVSDTLLEELVNLKR